MLTTEQPVVPTIPPDHLARLAAFESVAEKLWPFVRYFALAGAHPDAIEAVAELARLLGKSSTDHDTIAAAVRQAQRSAAGQIADWFENSEYHRAMMASMRVRFLQELRQLAAQE